MAVHDVEMDEVGAPLFAQVEGAREVGQVGGEERGGEPHQGAPSAVATTSEIASSRLTGWPGSGNWRRITPAATPS